MLAPRYVPWSAAMIHQDGDMPLYLSTHVLAQRMSSSYFLGSMQVGDLRKVAADHPSLKAYDSVNLIHNGDVLADDTAALSTRFATNGTSCNHCRDL
jgi:hypothetical protein